MGTTRTMVHFLAKTNTWKRGDGVDMVLGDGRNAVASQTTSFVGRAYAGDPSYCVQMTPDNIYSSPGLLEQGPAFKSRINSRTVNKSANCAARGYNSQVANPEMVNPITKVATLVTYGAWFHQ